MMSTEEAARRYAMLCAIAKRMRLPAPTIEEMLARGLPPVLPHERFIAVAELWIAQRADHGPHPPMLEPHRIAKSVYFIAGADKIKIGSTLDVQKRLVGLQCGSPVELHLLHSMPGSEFVERHLHRQFSALRAHGEWFRAEAPLVEHIARLRERAARRAA